MKKMKLHMPLELVVSGGIFTVLDLSSKDTLPALQILQLREARAGA
jgi:hypothetical protein